MPSNVQKSDLALHYAAARGCLECVQLLMGTSPCFGANSLMDNDVTPVYLAAQEGHLEVLKYLVTKGGGSLYKQAKDGMAPIHAAAQMGCLDCIKWMVLDQKVNINLRDTDGATALHFAASRGHAETVSWLVSNNARIVVDKYGKSPIHDASENDHVECLKILLREKDKMVESEPGSNGLDPSGKLGSEGSSLSPPSSPSSSESIHSNDTDATVHKPFYLHPPQQSGIDIERGLYYNPMSDVCYDTVSESNRENDINYNQILNNPLNHCCKSTDTEIMGPKETESNTQGSLSDDQCDSILDCSEMQPQKVKDSDTSSHEPFYLHHPNEIKLDPVKMMFKEILQPRHEIVYPSKKPSGTSSVVVAEVHCSDTSKEDNESHVEVIPPPSQYRPLPELPSECQAPQEQSVKCADICGESDDAPSDSESIPPPPEFAGTEGAQVKSVPGAFRHCEDQGEEGDDEDDTYTLPLEPIDSSECNATLPPPPPPPLPEVYTTLQKKVSDDDDTSSSVTVDEDTDEGLPQPVQRRKERFKEERKHRRLTRPISLPLSIEQYEKHQEEEATLIQPKPLIKKQMALPFIPPKFPSPSDPNCLIKPSEYLKSISKCPPSKNYEDKSSEEPSSLSSSATSESGIDTCSVSSQCGSIPPPPLPAIQETDNLDKTDTTRPFCSGGSSSAQLCAPISLQDLQKVQLRKTNDKLSKTVSCPIPTTPLTNGDLNPKKELIEELKISKDIDGIRRLREERVKAEMSPDFTQNSELNKQFTVENFLDKIPLTDNTGNPVPIWKRQMLARKAAEKAKKEAEEDRIREAEEKRLLMIPLWKRQLIMKKEQSYDKKPEADPLKSVPKEPEVIIIEENLKPEIVVPPHVSEETQSAVFDWRQQLKKTNSRLNLTE